MQNPHAVQLLFMVGLNSPIKSIAFSKHGSLQAKHITPLWLKQAEILMCMRASMSFLLSMLKTPNSHAFAHSSQYVQPLFTKLKNGEASSNK
jgi:hypothetical protein